MLSRLQWCGASRGVVSMNTMPVSRERRGALESVPGKIGSN